MWQRIKYILEHKIFLGKPVQMHNLMVISNKKHIMSQFDFLFIGQF